MYKIEKIGDDLLYLKFTGNLPDALAKDFVKNFKAITKTFSKFSILVDCMDAGFLNISSFKVILGLMEENNKKLKRSSFAILHNPPLDKEIHLLIEKAESQNRKIFSNLNDAKDWIGIKDIILSKE